MYSFRFVAVHTGLQGKQPFVKSIFSKLQLYRYASEKPDKVLSSFALEAHMTIYGRILLRAYSDRALTCSRETAHMTFD